MDTRALESIVIILQIYSIIENNLNSETIFMYSSIHFFSVCNLTVQQNRFIFDLIIEGFNFLKIESFWYLFTAFADKRKFIFNGCLFSVLRKISNYKNLISKDDKTLDVAKFILR